MKNFDQNGLAEYFQDVLGVEHVILPPASLNAEVPGVLSAVPHVGTLSNYLREDRAVSELVVFAESQRCEVSFFEGECKALLEKMTLAMKLEAKQISKVRLADSITSLSELSCGGIVVYMGLPEETVLDHPVDNIRGQWLGDGIITYHPSHLLKDSSAKKPAWSDLQWVMRELSKR